MQEMGKFGIVGQAVYVQHLYQAIITEVIPEHYIALSVKSGD